MTELAPAQIFLDGKVELRPGDCRDVIKAMPDASVDSVVCDPPYALVSIGKRFGADGAKPTKDGDVYARASSGFMGKQWDTGETAFAAEFWAEVLRVLKPGGHVVAFSGTRTYHRMAVAIEDAGFEIRDSIYWHYGSGFPKSHSVNKALEAKGLACNCHTATPYSHNEDETQNLHSVRCRMDAEGQVSSGAQPDVQPAMQGHADKQDSGSRESGADDSVRDVRDVDSQTGVAVKAKRKGVLQRIVSEQVVCGSAEALRCERQGEEESRQGDGVREEPCVEGRRNAEASARELQGSSVYSGAGVGEADGSQGRLHNGASSSDGQDVRISTDPHGSGEPHRQDASEQRADKSGTVADKRGPQTWGGWPLCGGCGKPIVAEGLGTALKPATEPICLARKPLIGTVAANVLEHGTGALNIDGCRVGDEERFNPAADYQRQGVAQNANILSGTDPDAPGRATTGRWPANIVHDGSDEVLAGFPGESGGAAVARNGSKSGGIWSESTGLPAGPQYADSGSAARFFYTAKADKTDRMGSKHPTVKPVDLMQWLCRMVTPPGGVVLDPFAGSGSTGEAAWREGMRCILIEREAEYQADIAARLNLADKGPATRKARSVKQANDNLPLFGAAA